MPNQLKEGTSRVSYVEADEIHHAFKIMSVYKGASISALMRLATEQFLEREDPSGVIVKQARKAKELQSDTPGDRAKDSLDPKIIELAKVLHMKLAT